MTEIERARTVLAKWREKSTAGPWKVQGLADDAYAPRFETIRRDDAVLIVGTAGSPDLLDAIDEFLSFEQRSEQVFKMMPNRFATSIAAAIIAADERMSA